MFDQPHHSVVHSSLGCISFLNALSLVYRVLSNNFNPVVVYPFISIIGDIDRESERANLDQERMQWTSYGRL